MPYVVRLASGLRKPKRTIPGTDVAGRVEAVGREVSRRGVRVVQRSLRRVRVRSRGQPPADAGQPHVRPGRCGRDSAFTALTAVRDHGKVQSSLGARVTGVCSTGNVDMVRSIGADHVIDYTREDFTENGRRYDVMVDLIGNRSLSECRGALTARGTFVLVGVKDVGRWLGLGRQLRMLSLSPFVSQKMRMFIATHNRELVEAGKVTPVIGSRHELSEVPEALLRQGEGHARGKIVIALSG